MSHFQLLQTQSQLPLPQQSIILLLCVESRCYQLLTPERSMCWHSKIKWKFEIVVPDVELVVCCVFEGPNVLFIQPVVLCYLICIWRIGVGTFSLDIIPVKFLIIIFPRQDIALTNNSAFLRLELLQSFKVTIPNHINIINIIQEMRILFYRFMEPCEGIVQDLLVNKS